MRKNLRHLLPAAVLSAATIGAMIGATPPAEAQPAAPNLTSTSLLSGRDVLWDLALLPDGTIFFTERCRGLSVRLPSGTVHQLLGMAGTSGYADTAADLFCNGQAGMAGVAVDPNFAANRFVYVYSASNLTAPGTNRVVRLTVNADLTRVANRTDIITDIPYKPQASDHPFGDPGAHNGGRLRFGPGDGFLYVTTGDIHGGAVPQSPTILGGKVLRVDRDGRAAPGNNAAAGFDARIFTYGHRNPQGICFRPGTNAVFTAEHGPWHTDEVTQLRPGGNAGWDPRPNVNGRGACPDGYCGYSPNQMGPMPTAERAAFMPMTDTRAFPNAMRPAWVNDGMSQGMSACTFLSGSQWRGWDGRMIVAYLGIGIHGTPTGNRLDLLDISADGQSSTRSSVTLPIPAARFRSVVQGPSGNLYVGLEAGEIVQIRPN